MLQNGFFMTDPFNPNPYWDNVIVNLSGAQKFEENTVFKPGRYKIEVKAGSANEYSNFGGFGGLITENIVVNRTFIVRAYCGSAGKNTNFGGINPYVGPFKVNGYSVNGVPPTVNHIFGNAGSVGGGTGYDNPSSGNSLGDGAIIDRYGWTSGAGSCLHILPVGGVFGTDYLFAFHTTGGATGLNVGGTGGAYGGGASGASYSIFGESVVTTSNGGSTPYGQGGAGVNNREGNNGTGIGHGNNSGVGAAAWFNGTSWQDSTADPLSVSIRDGYIRITFLGPLN
ncbi:MAG: hypothetical protein J6S67_14050 [Methanobrevibacter sp.]|nr:hypothetical protein [Methanobrevibacter sp.]